ncbi:MAG: imidazolonepropionase-like amidohydrolase [Alphaproteobacteria bacterium]|jgi:imidazolonepropionase-like amidohydrolase
MNAAELLGVDDRGELGAGKRAGILVMPGNSLKKVTVMESVFFGYQESLALNTS